MGTEVEGEGGRLGAGLFGGVGDGPESVLIVKPSSLGDVVHTLPALAALKRHWPGSRFRWLVNPEWAPMLEGNPALEEVFLFPRRQFRGVLAPWKWGVWLREFARRGAADMVLDFQGLLRSALVGRVCARRGFYGLSDAREGARYVYDGVVRVDGRQHAVDRYLALARAVGAPVDGPLEWGMPVGTGDAIGGGEPFIVVHPYARGAGKSMEAAELASLCAALAPWPVWVVGRGDGGVPEGAHVRNLLNQTSLGELVEVMRRAAWVVSVDSGPMHVAAAVNPRLLALHTWSDPQRVGPYPLEAWVWQRGKIFQRGTPEVVEEVVNALEVGAWVKRQLESGSAGRG